MTALLRSSFRGGANICACGKHDGEKRRFFYRRSIYGLLAFSLSGVMTFAAPIKTAVIGSSEVKAEENLVRTAKASGISGGEGAIAGGSRNNSCDAPKDDLFRNPYNKDSAFHRPIGSSAQYANDADPSTLSWLQAGSATINSRNGWGIYMGVADPSHPLVPITWAGGNWGGRQQFPISLRVPPDFDPGNTVDAQSTIYDPSTRTAHDFYHWVAPNTASLHHPEPLDGLGHGLLPDGSRNWAASASGVWGFFGVLRGFEVNTPGYRIQHATQMAISSKTTNHCAPQLGKEIVWPATSQDGGCTSSSDVWCTGNIPYGSLFALPPSIDVAGIGLSEPGQRLAHAFQDYGVYIVDNANCPAIRADQYVNDAVIEQLKNDLSVIYPMMRRVLNNAQHQTASGGGAPRAPNCAFDAD